MTYALPTRYRSPRWNSSRRYCSSERSVSVSRHSNFQSQRLGLHLIQGLKLWRKSTVERRTSQAVIIPTHHSSGASFSANLCIFSHGISSPLFNGFWQQMELLASDLPIQKKQKRNCSNLLGHDSRQGTTVKRWVITDAINTYALPPILYLNIWTKPDPYHLNRTFCPTSTTLLSGIDLPLQVPSCMSTDLFWLTQGSRPSSDTMMVVLNAFEIAVFPLLR